MLSRAHRMRRPEEFRAAIRAGARAGSGTVVLHLAVARPDAGSHEARIGFIVNKSVGSAVLRNRVRRRLRHLLRTVPGRLPSGSLLVVRALPAAAEAPGEVLARDVASCLERVRRKAAQAVPA